MKHIVYVISGQCNNEHIIDCYIETIKSIFKNDESWEVYHETVSNVGEFQKKINDLRDKLAEGENRVILDIQCHGNNYGLSFSNEINGFLPWQMLSEFCKEINTDAERQVELCLILSSCFSFGFAAYLHNGLFNNVCQYLLCTSTELKGIAATESLERIFRYISEGHELIYANEKAKQEIYEERANNRINIPLNPFELFMFR